MIFTQVVEHRAVSVTVRRCAMVGDVWRLTHLTTEQMEERRLVAATLLRQGQLSHAKIARHVGGSRASVCRWADTVAQEDPRGLTARSIPRPSPASMTRP
ncbi:helix-turn-helix domain-containing protein [Microvirga terrae]|uniref:helix-turn-helix domain-containing protein n=1 Tax=Microvirga terrae TaxID=2740529 RepID=UPI003D812CDF